MTSGGWWYRTSLICTDSQIYFLTSLVSCVHLQAALFHWCDRCGLAGSLHVCHYRPVINFRTFFSRSRREKRKGLSSGQTDGSCAWPFRVRAKSWLPWQPPGVHLRLSKFPSPRWHLCLDESLQTTKQWKLEEEKVGLKPSDHKSEVKSYNHSFIIHILISGFLQTHFDSVFFWIIDEQLRPFRCRSFHVSGLVLAWRRVFDVSH